MEGIEKTIDEQAMKVMPLVRSKVPPDDFDDMMQDIRMAFLVALPKFRGDNGAKLETFAQGIARHRIADYLRNQYRWKKTVKELIKDYVQADPEPEKAEKIKVNFLSPAELAVLRLLGKGKSNDEIAAALFRSSNTIRSHLKAIYGKLGCHNRVTISLLAQRMFKEE